MTVCHYDTTREHFHSRRSGECKYGDICGCDSAIILIHTSQQGFGKNISCKIHQQIWLEQTSIAQSATLESELGLRKETETGCSRQQRGRPGLGEARRGIEECDTDLPAPSLGCGLSQWVSVTFFQRFRGRMRGVHLALWGEVFCFCTSSGRNPTQIQTYYYDRPTLHFFV